MNINFRAWHKGNKEMLKVVAIDFLRGQIATLYQDTATKLPLWLPQEEFEIMQETPFEDMFGTPIFEGDILTDSKGGLYKVGRVETGHLKGRWLANETSLNVLLNNHLLVILGNIHTNPELLRAVAAF